MTTYGISESGFTPKSLQLIIQEKQNLARSEELFGSMVDLSPTSPLKKFIEIISIEEFRIWKVLEDIYYSAYLDTATGQSLDNVVSLLGITRREAERSQGTVRFYTGDAPIASGSSIPILSGSIIMTSPPNSLEFQTIEDVEVVPYIYDEIDLIEEESGNYFVTAQNLVYSCDFIYVSELPNREGDNLFSGLVEEQRIYLSGSLESSIGDPVYVSYRPLSVDAKAESRFGGSEYNINANEISIIQPFVNSNLLTVSNPAPFEGGDEAETDEELRLRAKNFSASFGRGTVDSIIAAISSLSGVKSVTGLENYSDEIQDGIPPHSLLLYVYGGAEEDILNTIEAYRPAGIQVSFERPTEIPIYITAIVRYLSTANFLTLESRIKSAILDYFDSLSPGDDVRFFEIANQISNVEGVSAIESNSLFIGLDPNPTGTEDIEIAENNQVAVSSTDLISLTLIPEGN